jgi:hypothetical protein
MRIRINSYRRTYIFDPNERANVRNVVAGMLGSACVFIYRQIRPVRSSVRCENHERDEMNERSRDLFPLTEVNTTIRFALKIVGVPVAKIQLLKFSFTLLC